MRARGIILAGVFALAALGRGTFAAEADWLARIAGDGPDGIYYVAKDADAGIVVNQLHALEIFAKKGEPPKDAGFHLKDVEAALTQVHTLRDAFLKKGRILQVVYNLPVMTLEKDQTIHYALFPDTKVTFGKDYKGSLTRVRIEDGPLKGREFYARRVVDRKKVVASDRAWLRAPDMKAIAVSENAEAATRFWRALAHDDKTAAAQAYIDGEFQQLPPDTPCTVVGLSTSERFAKVRVEKDGAKIDYWVLATIASLDPPK
jgi:hypothetical protein